MTTTRVYKLATNPETGLLPNSENELLIEATTAAQAYRHVARKTWNATVATQTDLIELIGRGVKVEKASDE